MARKTLLKRLGARNVAFVSNLMEAGIEFATCDNLHASRLTIHVLAAEYAKAAPEKNRLEKRLKEIKPVLLQAMTLRPCQPG
ncbi:hypothetical protein ACFQU7_37065 [Pseudoroseomonas wenyumeiae]|uniref:hypothetical protein n=1 Tax=Teichococcus wenyumeiae TaxID=2478470 RepID=UPI0018F485AB|nr:hypothetical protein [Pseudoroseomonas wenyumeiae]